jgi:hypothetical protein
LQVAEHAKTPDERHTERRPTTSTSLPIEDQVREEWKAALAHCCPGFCGGFGLIGRRSQFAGWADATPVVWAAGLRAGTG